MRVKLKFQLHNSPNGHLPIYRCITYISICIMYIVAHNTVGWTFVTNTANMCETNLRYPSLKNVFFFFRSPCWIQVLTTYYLFTLSRTNWLFTLFSIVLFNDDEVLHDRRKFPVLHINREVKKKKVKRVTKSLVFRMFTQLLKYVRIPTYIFEYYCY